MRKTHAELQEIAKRGRYLINQNDKILLLKSYHAVEWIEFKDIKSFQFPKDTPIMNIKDQCHFQKQGVECFYRDINVSIPKD